MNRITEFDQNTLAIVGGIALVLILASKLNSDGAKDVLNNLIGATKEYAVAKIGNC